MSPLRPVCLSRWSPRPREASPPPSRGAKRRLPLGARDERHRVGRRAPPTSQTHRLRDQGQEGSSSIRAKRRRASAGFSGTVETNLPAPPGRRRGERRLRRQASAASSRRARLPRKLVESWPPSRRCARSARSPRARATEFGLREARLYAHRHHRRQRTQAHHRRHRSGRQRHLRARSLEQRSSTCSRATPLRDLESGETR